MTRLEQLQARTRGWLPIEEWGPVCAGCGGDEYRLDGYCSLECRDYHSDEDVGDLLAVAVAAIELQKGTRFANSSLAPLRAALAPLLEEAE